MIEIAHYFILSPVTPKDLLSKYDKHDAMLQLIAAFASPHGCFHAKGMVGSSRSMVIAKIFRQLKSMHFVVMENEEKAEALFGDLTNLVGAKHILYLPSAFKQSIFSDQHDSTNLLMRTEVLSKLISGDGNGIIVSYPEAIVEKIVSGKEFKESMLEIHQGERVAIETIEDIMHEYLFEKVDFVFQPGQFSVRGSIVDIFSYSHPEPYRLDFFGDDIESIRTFDISSQLSKEILTNVTIVPNLQEKTSITTYESLFTVIPKSATVWFEDSAWTLSVVDTIAEKASTHFSGNDKMLSRIDASDTIKALLTDKRVIDLGVKALFEPTHSIDFQTSLQPVFNKNFDLLGKTFESFQNDGYTTIFFTENSNQVQRLEDVFKETFPKLKFSSMLIALNEGFVDHDLKVCCFTDHQIFERHHGNNVKERFAPKESLTIKDLTNLSVGDYVVHIDHGIGKFSGLVKTDVNGKMQESVKLVYQDSDVLFVGIHNLHKISKYKSKEGVPPKIHKLGSGIWERTKQKTKSKVKDIAKELIALYAERKSQKGFSFSPDTYMQQELEASFFFEDTPDQLKATRAVKVAMERDYPMDMLVCGDVGFGKTEIAIRAAFKAVADSKQVAVLVPTTVLALQHFKTFSMRLKDFPCNVDFVCRLKSTKQINETLKNAAAGKVDILIGTHRLVSKDVKFKNLGLLIIDEEQKFGVTVKEKLKHMKVNVDSLTLTATPIPRTLQFSLMGARDLAIISTPPPNRFPVVTELHPFNEELIKSAIEFEMNRNGQVFFLHNKVQSIYEIEAYINKICPKAKTIVGHGQMDGEKLEEVMLSFINGDYDVLVATTIIESGIDIPNANTIIINDAQNFGLSDLHQLRGRVGRSNKKAFAYLMVPSLSILTPEARTRLTAIEEISQLGGGFNIALQDLDIRGAGNMLGAEQSGFIADIGYETYQKILNEAMQELRENEFKDLYEHEAEEHHATLPDNFAFVNDCHIESDFEMMFPEEYVGNTTERIRLYRELDNIESEERLQEFEKSLIDRFGRLPSEAVSLLNVVRLRWLATRLAIDRIVLKKGKMTNYFVTNQESPFYQSEVFGKVLEFVKMHPKTCMFVEKNDRLTLSFEAVHDIEKGIRLLEKVKGEEVVTN